MRRLSGIDTAALALETDASPLHMMAVLVLDTSVVPGGYRYERLREFLATRIDVVPPLLQLLRRVPGELHRPVWVDAPAIDWDYHLPRTILTEPLDLSRLGAFAAELAGRRLDRDRPLWQLHVVEDAGTERVAIIARVHHALMDGLGGMEFMGSLFDLEPGEHANPQGQRTAPVEVPSRVALVGGALADLPRLTTAAVRFATDAFHQVRAATIRRDAADDAQWSPLPFTAPRTIFNGKLTPARSVALTELPFEVVRAIKSATGATINDVVLAVVTGAVRTLLIDRNALPNRPLVAGVPAATDTAGVAFGNALAFLWVWLPTDIDDPLERLERVQHAAHTAKRTGERIGLQTLAHLLDVFTPLPIDAMLALYRSVVIEHIPPLWNLMVSNVPGPPVPLYVAGARLVGLFPLGPIYEGLGLNLTVLSREESLDVGIVACRDLVGRLDELAMLLETELDALARATGVPAEAKPQ